MIARPMMVLAATTLTIITPMRMMKESDESTGVLSPVISVSCVALTRNVNRTRGLFQ